MKTVRATRPKTELPVILKNAIARGLVRTDECRAGTIHSLENAILGNIASSFKDHPAPLRWIGRVSETNSVQGHVGAFAMPKQFASRCFHDHASVRGSWIFGACRRDVQPLIREIDREIRA